MARKRSSAVRQREREEGGRADMSEVIEARGHAGRKSHESRASGREQCREARLLLLLLLLLLLPLSALLPPPLVRRINRSFLVRRFDLRFDSLPV